MCPPLLDTERPSPSPIQSFLDRQQPASALPRVSYDYRSPFAGPWSRPYSVCHGVLTCVQEPFPSRTECTGGCSTLAACLCHINGGDGSTLSLSGTFLLRPVYSWSLHVPPAFPKTPLLRIVLALVGPPPSPAAILSDLGLPERGLPPRCMTGRPRRQPVWGGGRNGPEPTPRGKKRIYPD